MVKQSRLIKRMQVVYLIAVLSIALLIFSKYFWFHSRDIERYQKMLRKKELSSSLQASYNPTHQQRSKVRKEIWLTQEDLSRLHYRIESRESLLTLTPVKNKFEVIEVLQAMHCWMQEKLLPTGQQTRYFEAEEGLYRYHTSQLIAQEAALSFYRLPGKDLPNKPLDNNSSYLSGIAQTISLTFGGKIPEFKATHFKATLKEQAP